MSESIPLIGRVVATEKRPNTAHEFHFWTSLDSPIGIGTIVRVDAQTPVGGVLPRIYGVVVEGFSYTDLASPIHDVLGHDGSPSGASIAPTQRAEIRLYTAHVLRQIPEEPLQPVPMGTVALATREALQTSETVLRDLARAREGQGLFARLRDAFVVSWALAVALGACAVGLVAWLLRLRRRVTRYEAALFRVLSAGRRDGSTRRPRAGTPALAPPPRPAAPVRARAGERPVPIHRHRRPGRRAPSSTPPPPRACPCSDRPDS